jgi:hypothetical protein
MFRKHWLHGLLPMIAASALVVLSPTGAEADANRDTSEVNAFRLTDAGLARYAQAARNVAQLGKQSSTSCAADEDDEDSGNGKSIDQMVASLDANAKIRSAIQSAGMTTREYVVFGMAVFQAGMTSWALDQPGGKLPPGMAMDNVTFYRKHDAAMRKLGEETKAADCGEAGEDEPQ